jgi:hypothetical protein
LAEANHLISVVLDSTEKRKSRFAGTARPIEKQRVSFENNEPGRQKAPSLLFRAREQLDRVVVVRIIVHKNSEEAAGVDEDGLHRPFFGA